VGKAAFLCFLWFACGGPALAQEAANSNVLVAHGMLSRTGKAGTLWTLTPNDSPKVHDELILKVTFSTRAGEESRAYGPFEEKDVELAGEVKYVFHGNAVLGKIRTIGIVSSPVQYLRGDILGAAGAPPVSSPVVTERVPYKHAYYLFLDGPRNGCEACYVPLVMSQDSLEQIAKNSRVALGVLIFTYERDSIWEIKGAMPIDPGSIEGPSRMIRALGRSYRYQEISPSEVLKLLEEPTGTIPISRPYVWSKSVPGASMSELISDFRALLPAASPLP